MKILNLFLFSILFLSLLTSVSAQSEEFFVSKEDGIAINLTLPCGASGGGCNSGFICNFSIYYPDDSPLLENVSMTFKRTGQFNYTIPSQTTLGDYYCGYVCYNTTTYTSFSECTIRVVDNLDKNLFSSISTSISNVALNVWDFVLGTGRTANVTVTEIHEFTESSNRTIGEIVVLSRVINTTVQELNLSITSINRTLFEIREYIVPTNRSVILNETITSGTIGTSSNITIHYNISIPVKFGTRASDLLPLRLKFWILNSSSSCVNLFSKTESVKTPFCNYFLAEYIGNGTVAFTVSLQPSLAAGNYSLIREIEIDPENIWFLYGREKISTIQILPVQQKKNYLPFIISLITLIILTTIVILTKKNEKDIVVADATTTSTSTTDTSRRDPTTPS